MLCCVLVYVLSLLFVLSWCVCVCLFCLVYFVVLYCVWCAVRVVVLVYCVVSWCDVLCGVVVLSFRVCFGLCWFASFVMVIDLF